MSIQTWSGTSRQLAGTLLGLGLAAALCGGAALPVRAAATASTKPSPVPTTASPATAKPVPAAKPAPAAPAALRSAEPLRAAAPIRAAEPIPAAGRMYPDPRRFEKAILAFEAADLKAMPAPGGIVCVGSSTMAGWNSTIRADLAPLQVIPRGFGGSNMNDALFYVDRVVLRYKPRAVVLYEGDNDVAQGISPERIRDTFRALAKAIHDRLPEARIYVISIKPSPRRAALLSTAVEANRLLRAACAADRRLTFVSIVEAMTGPDGKVREDIFKTDRLHMTSKGYALWRDVLKPVLMKGEAAPVAPKPVPVTATAAPVK